MSGRHARKTKGVAGIGGVLLIVAVYLLFGPGAFEAGEPTEGVGDGSVERSGEQAVAVGSIDPALRSAISAERSGVMVSLSAEVVKVLPDDNEGSRHQRLLLVLDEAVGDVDTILIAHNIDLAERVPCDEGDRLLVRGQYEWNDKGGVIHWTHHDPKKWREGGWIEHAGVRYE